MSIFRTSAPSKATMPQYDQSVTVYSDKEPAANMKGQRMGAQHPQRNVQHVPNAAPDRGKGQS